MTILAMDSFRIPLEHLKTEYDIKLISFFFVFALSDTSYFLYINDTDISHVTWQIALVLYDSEEYIIFCDSAPTPNPRPELQLGLA